MIDGNPHYFIDTAYTGQDIVYLYHGIKYWFQGYTLENGICHMEVYQYQPSKEDEIWSHDDTSMDKCLEEFLKAPIFDGKTFWEAEQEITWVDY